MDDQKRYERAKKKVENLKSFYMHLTVFILVNIFLIIINWSTYDGYWWFVFPLGGWAIGLIVHGATVFAGSAFGVEWEERKIQEYMERDKRRD